MPPTGSATIGPGRPVAGRGSGLTGTEACAASNARFTLSTPPLVHRPARLDRLSTLSSSSAFTPVASNCQR
eukprot:353408-Chlamydomonas_euryale.AAC.8